LTIANLINVTLVTSTAFHVLIVIGRHV